MLKEETKLRIEKGNLEGDLAKYELENQEVSVQIVDLKQEEARLQAE